MNAQHEAHAAEAKANQSKARGRMPAEPKINLMADGGRPAETVEVKPDPEAVAVALTEAKPTNAAAVKSAPKAKAAKPKATKVAQEKVPGRVVRDFMAEFDLSGKDIAAAGGFSLSRVAELRNLEMPASWNGRDRHATVTQWEAVSKAARALAAKKAARAAKGK